MQKQQSWNSVRGWWWVSLGLPVLIGLGWLLYPWLLKPPIVDESLFLYEGWLTANGKLPYRDFFEFIGPGTLWFVAGWIKLFGMSLLAIRSVMVLCLLLCVALTIRLTRFFLPKGWLWGLLCFFGILYLRPLMVDVQHHTLSTLAGLLMITSLDAFIQTSTGSTSTQANPIPLTEEAHHKNIHSLKASSCLWVSGILGGLCLITTQTLGVLLLGMATLYLVLYLSNQAETSLKRKHPIRHAVSRVGGDFLLPACLPLAATLLFYASQQALPDFIAATWTWLFQGGYSKTTSHWYLLEGYAKLLNYAPFAWRRLNTAVEFGTIALQAVLPILGLLWGSQVIWEKIPRTGFRIEWAAVSSKQWRFLLIWLGAITFFLSSFSYPSTILVSIHGWLYYALAFAALADLNQRTPLIRTLSFYLLVFLLAGRLNMALVQSVQAYQLPWIASYGTREKWLAPLNLQPDAIPATNTFVRLLHEQTPPGEPLFVYNGAPEIYLLTGRENPTRYQLLMSVYNTPAQIQEVVSSLNRTKPRFIIYNQLDDLNFQYDLRFRALRHYDYQLHTIERVLEKHYVLAARLNNMLLFQRVEPGH